MKNSFLYVTPEEKIYRGYDREEMRP